MPGDILGQKCYRKTLKIGKSKIIPVNVPNIHTLVLGTVMCQNVDAIPNSVDTEQTAPMGAL